MKKVGRADFFLTCAVRASITEITIFGIMVIAMVMSP